MATKISQSIKVAFVAIITIVVFVPMLLNKTDGADFYKYYIWAMSFNQSNIFCNEGHILSPQGVPLSQWSFGPGLIFSLGGLFSSFTPEHAVFVGWLFTVVFWVSYTGILLHATKNNLSLTLFGVCITFIGTPLGYYSSAYASESLSYTCLSVLIYWILSRNRFGLFDYLVVGIWASLLVAIRSQLALYVVPVYLVILFRIWNEVRAGNASIQRSSLHLLIFHVPVLLAISATLTVNYWMTGSYLTSVYEFGFGDFKSIDFLHPELSAVLIHPWHGLFVYHPLYLLCFASLVVVIFKHRNSLQSLLLVVAAIVIMLHIYLHASWYAWWLGLDSFGMRGLSICGIVLVPVLIKLLSEREDQGKSNSVWIILILFTNIWSFVLLTHGTTQYYTYKLLASGIRSAIDNLIDLGFIILPALVFVVGVVGVLLFGKHHSLLSFKNLVITVLLLIVVHYQDTQLFYERFGMSAISLVSLVVTILILIGYHAVVEVYQKHSIILARTLLISSVLSYVAMTVMFTNLAVTTNQIINAKLPPPPTSIHVSTVDTDEVRLTYLEYMSVPGFIDKKANLSKYVDYLVTKDEATRLR